MYDPSKFKVREAPQEGTQLPAVVVSIEEGTCGSFLTPDRLAKWKHSSASSVAIRVTVEAEHGRLRREKVIQLPEDDILDSRSILSRWKRQYGDYPFVGQQVKLVADVKGQYGIL